MQAFQHPDWRSTKSPQRQGLQPGVIGGCFFGQPPLPRPPPPPPKENLITDSLLSPAGERGRQSKIACQLLKSSSCQRQLLTAYQEASHSPTSLEEEQRGLLEALKTPVALPVITGIMCSVTKLRSSLREVLFCSTFIIFVVLNGFA